MESYEVQLKDFKKAEQELTGKERVFISQDNNTRSTTIDEIRKPLAEQLNEKANAIDTSPVYLGAFFENNDNIGNNLFITGDGKSILKINNKNVFNGRDTSILCRNGFFYFFHTQISGTDCIEVEITKDLVNFETKSIKVTNDGSTIWAPEIFENDNKIYIIYSKQVGTEILGSTSYKDMRPFIVEITDLNTLTIETPRQLILEGDSKINDNRIDGHIVKKDNKYYLFVKFNGMNGVNPNGAIEIWESSNLTDWKCINEGINNWIGIEAPYICEIDGIYHLYVDDFTPLNNVEGSFYTNNGGVTLYATSTDLLNWDTNFKILNTEIGTRHGFITKVIDEDCKRIIVNKTIPSLNTIINNYSTKISNLQTVTDVIGTYNNIQFIISNNIAYGAYRGFIPLKNASDYNITLIKMSYMEGMETIEVTNTATLGDKNKIGFMVNNTNESVAGKVCLLWFKVAK